jgi:hypothetical protein
LTYTIFVCQLHNNKGKKISQLVDSFITPFLTYHAHSLCKLPWKGRKVKDEEEKSLVDESQILFPSFAPIMLLIITTSLRR